MISGEQDNSSQWSNGGKTKKGNRKDKIMGWGSWADAAKRHMKNGATEAGSSTGPALIEVPCV